MLTVFHCGTCWVQNSMTSATSRTDGSGGKTNSFWAWNSLSMSFWIVPRSCRQSTPSSWALARKKAMTTMAGCIDRHGHRYVGEVDAAKKLVNVVKRIDGDSEPADLAQRPGVVAIEAHEGRQVERRAEPGLAFFEQKAESFVGLPRRAEARKLAHRPEPAAVHGGMDAAREGVLTGVAEIGVVVEAVQALRRVERLDRDAADRRRRRFADGRCRRFLLPALESGAVSGGCHDLSFRLVHRY